MVAATVNLPDDLYVQLERLARAQGVSVAELIRQGAETLVENDRLSTGRDEGEIVEPAKPMTAEQWSFPTVHAGQVKTDVPIELWRELANESGWAVEKAIAEGRLDELRED